MMRVIVYFDEKLWGKRFSGQPGQLGGAERDVQLPGQRRQGMAKSIPWTAVSTSEVCG